MGTIQAPTGPTHLPPAPAQAQPASPPLSAAGLYKHDSEANLRWRMENLVKHNSLWEETLRRSTFATWRGNLNPGCREGYEASVRFTRVVPSPGDLPWLVLHGPSGTGKTHLLAAVIGSVIRDSICWTAGELGDEIFSRLKSRTLDELSAELRQIPILALDDLGTEGGGEFVRVELHKILDARYQARKRTMITTNVDVGAFPPRLASRLQDAYVCRWVEMQGADVRQMVERGA